MVKISEEEVVRTKRTHTFYCDSCQKELGSSTEYDDGYVEEKGSYDFNTRVDSHGWVGIHGYLCEECKKKVDDDIAHMLEDIGNEYNLKYTQGPYDPDDYEEDEDNV
jgi:uncharacterized protein YlaI